MLPTLGIELVPPLHAGHVPGVGRNCGLATHPANVVKMHAITLNLRVTTGHDGRRARGRILGCCTEACRWPLVKCKVNQQH